MAGTGSSFEAPLRFAPQDEGGGFHRTPFTEEAGGIILVQSLPQGLVNPQKCEQGAGLVTQPNKNRPASLKQSQSPLRIVLM